MLPLQGAITYPLPLVDNSPNFPALGGICFLKLPREVLFPQMFHDVTSLERSSFSQVNQPFQLSGGVSTVTCAKVLMEYQWSLEIPEDLFRGGWKKVGKVN